MKAHVWIVEWHIVGCPWEPLFSLGVYPYKKDAFKAMKTQTKETANIRHRVAKYVREKP